MHINLKDFIIYFSVFVCVRFHGNGCSNSGDGILSHICACATAASICRILITREVNPILQFTIQFTEIDKSKYFPGFQVATVGSTYHSFNLSFISPISMISNIFQVFSCFYPAILHF